MASVPPDTPQSGDVHLNIPELPVWTDPCPYLPGLQASNHAFITDCLPPEIYQSLMDCGFRRSGKVIYRPLCPECRQCIPIRVKIVDFRPSRSQRRSLTKNQDLLVEVGPPRLTPEKYALYCQYIASRHPDIAGRKKVSDDQSMGAVESFLYNSPTRTVEMTYRDQAGRLLAVGLCDVCPTSLSSVYCYFDPQYSRRGLGTFSALWEIQFAQDQGLAYYYLGYVVSDCRAMRYKSAFRPFQLLGPDGLWHEGNPSSAAL